MWTLTPLIVSTGVVALLCLLMFIAIWEQRSLPGAAPLGLLMIVVGWWVIGAVLEDTAVVKETQILWAKLQYLGIEAAPVCWLWFALEYSRLIDRLPRWLRRNLVWLWAFPALTFIMVLTNEQHWLIWSQIVAVPLPDGSGEYLRYDHGFWFWAAAAYNYFLMAGGALVLIWTTWRIVQSNRMQAYILVLGAALPFIANVLYLSRLLPPEIGDLTPTALMFTVILYAWGIFRYRLFDLVPIAREALVDRLADSMIVMDSRERLLYVNPAAQQLFKLTTLNASETSKKRFSIRGKYPGIDAERAFAAQPEFLRHIREDRSGEIVIVDPRGEQRYFKLITHQLTAQDGRLAGKLVLLQDITSIKVSEARFRSIVDIVPAAILLINHAGEIVLSNAQCASVLGYSTDELLGRQVETLIPERFGFHRQSHPDFDLFSALENTAISTPMADGSEIYVLHRDGYEIPVEVNLSPMHTPNGDLMLVAARDISRRKAAEQKLHLQSAALESAATGIMITDIDGKIIWVNPAFTQITGFSAEDVIGRNPRLLNSGAHAPEYFDNMWQMILAGSIWEGEVFNRRKDGSLYVEEQTIAPVRDHQGLITHFISTKQDVSQRKQLEEQRDQLMHTIVHDLRNPLTSMLAAVDMLEYWGNKLEMETEPMEILQITRTSAWRMLGLVNTILDLAKLEAGKMQLNREPVVLTSLVEQIYRIESPLATRREVLLLNNVPFDLPIIQADQMLIGRVLQNLIDNALKFSPDGGNVELNAHFDAAQQAVIVAVHDDGPGISPDTQKRLFQKFSAGSKERGTGLGLAFCRIVIEAHGGKIWAENNSGSGAKLAFSLPLEESL